MQARLGSPKEYESAFPVEYPPALFDVDPSIDPAVVTPIAGRPLAAPLLSACCPVCLLLRKRQVDVVSSRVALVFCTHRVQVHPVRGLFASMQG